MPALGVPAWLSTWLQTPLQQTYLSTTHPSEHKDSCPEHRHVQTGPSKLFTDSVMIPVAMWLETSPLTC